MSFNILARNSETFRRTLNDGPRPVDNQAYKNNISREREREGNV